jgi:hypothetical protein
MLAFYRTVRAVDCDLAVDGDMLLFQWGTHNWGRGEHFSFNVTRQLIPAEPELGADEEEERDPGIWQLSLTLAFTPDTPLRLLGTGNRWCHHPDDLETFSAEVRSLSVFGAVANRRPEKVELHYENVE